MTLIDRIWQQIEEADSAAAFPVFQTVEAYRNVTAKPAGRTASYIVRTEGADYIFADWHGYSGQDKIAPPVDLLGRNFSVVASRNCSVVSQTLTGDLRVSVSAAAPDYGFVQIKVDH